MADPSAKYRVRRAWEYTSPRLGTDVICDVWGDLTDGTGGQWTIPCIDTTAHVYAFAGHEVISHTPTVYTAAGAVIDPAGYTFSASDDYESNGAIATITFTGDQSASEPISVKGKGRKDDSDDLIDNPAGIIQDFLVGRVGWSTSDLDLVAFARARSAAAARGWKAAGIIDSEERSIGATLTEVCKSFPGSWWIGRDGKLKLAFDSATYAETEIMGVIRIGPQRNAVSTIKLGNIANQVVAGYRHSRVADRVQAGDSGASTLDAVSQSRYGVRLRSMEMRWVRGADTASSIQALMVQLYADPRRVIEFDYTAPIALIAERGDLWLFSVDSVYDPQARPMRNQVVRVIEVNPDFKSRQTRITVLDTGMYKTVAYLADGTVIANGAHQAGGERDRTEY